MSRPGPRPAPRKPSVVTRTRLAAAKPADVERLARFLGVRGSRSLVDRVFAVVSR